MTLHTDVEKTSKSIARLVELLANNWAAVRVILDQEKRQLLEHSRDLAKQFHLNPVSVMVTDRAVVSIGMQTPWYACYMCFTPQSIGSVKPPVMRTKKLLHRGVKPSAESFNEPELPDNIYVLQAHTSWLHDLYECLSLDKVSGDEVSGNDAHNTKYVFA